MKFRGYISGVEHEIEVQPADFGYTVTIDGTLHNIDTRMIETGAYSLLHGERSYDVMVRESSRDEYVVLHGGFQRRIKLVNPLKIASGAHAAIAGPAMVRAVMPGRVVKLLVAEGDDVVEGQPVVVLEAMKMENDIPAPKSGRVTAIRASAGQNVEDNEPLLEIT